MGIDEKKWIDIIFRKQAQIASLKNILELKFWSIIAAILGLAAYSYKFLPHQFFNVKFLESTDFLAILTFLLILYWIVFIMQIKTAAFYSSRKMFKDIFSAEIETLENAIYSTVFLVGHLILIVHKNGIFYAGLFSPIVLVFVISIYTWMTIFSPHFGELFLKRQDYSRIELIKRILFWVAFINIIVLIIYYFLLSQKYSISIMADLKAAFFLFFLISLVLLAKETWESLNCLPNIDSLEFEIISGMFESEEDILERYEKCVLGVDAFLYIKNMISVEEKELRRIISELRKINKKIARKTSKRKAEDIDDLKIDKELLVEVDFKVSLKQIKRYKDLAKELGLKDNELRMIQKNIDKKIIPLKAEIRKLVREKLQG